MLNATDIKRNNNLLATIEYWVLLHFPATKK